jgi:hypothetical protein
MIHAGIRGRGTLAMLRSGNGVPETGLIAGVMIRQQARSEATIAVTAAGNAPYFSRRVAIDILGKTDPYIAHLAQRAGGNVGHGKFDIEYSLSRRPDVIVTPWSAEFSVEGLEPQYAASAYIDSDYRVALLRTRRFVEEYKDRALRIQYLWDDGDVSNAALYARQGTPEGKSLANWTQPIIGR